MDITNLIDNAKGKVGDLKAKASSRWIIGMCLLGYAWIDGKFMSPGLFDLLILPVLAIVMYFLVRK